MKHLTPAQLAQSHVLVVGDVMLDRYWYGAVDRISPEAPVPVLRVTREEERLGGAANVASNVAALGGQVSLLSVLGDDAASRQINGRHDGQREGQQRVAFAGALQLQQIARAMVLHRAYTAQFGATGVEHRQANQIRVVIFIIRQRGQFIAVGIKPHAAQSLGLIAIVHTA